MQETLQQRCQSKLNEAFKQLQAPISTQEISALAEQIVTITSRSSRHFHDTEHLLDVAESHDGIEILAALFHDLIYVQVDAGIALNQAFYLAPFIEEVAEQQISIREKLPEDRVYEMVASIFDVYPGQILSPLDGENEFLSALFAAKVLQTWLPLKILLQITVCIEATIPFRSISAEGMTPMIASQQRVQRLNQRFALGFSDSDIIATIKRAVVLANRDIQNFSDPNPVAFLNNTWHILPELNQGLSRGDIYTVREYRRTLQKMSSFLNSLPAERVVGRFADEPPESVYQTSVERIAYNLAIARAYLNMKLVAITLLEALALRLHDDTPVSLMTGGLPGGINDTHLHLENFLPELEQRYHPHSAIEAQILCLLEEGRTRDSHYDTKHSPLSAFMLKSLGFAEMQRLHKRALQMFAEEISAEAFLACCPTELVNATLTALVQLFEARIAVLRRGYED